jgi:hypothetical protein
MNFLAISILTVFFLFPINSFAQETKMDIDGIDRIEIHVKSHTVKIFKNQELVKTFSAATSSRKGEHSVPYEKIGRVWRIILNPHWFPTESIREEYRQKKNKILPKIVPPGKNNPLGKIRICFSINGSNSVLGIHGTSEPTSIGKRVTHACTRLGNDDLKELAGIIMVQNGINPAEFFDEAEKNPHKSIVIDIKNGPEVIHKKS